MSGIIFARLIALSAIRERCVVGALPEWKLMRATF